MFGIFDTLCDAIGDVKDAISEKIEDKIEAIGDKIVKKVEGDASGLTLKDKFFEKMRRLGKDEEEIERQWQSVCRESSARHDALMERLQANRDELQNRLKSFAAGDRLSAQLEERSASRCRERLDDFRKKQSGKGESPEDGRDDTDEKAGNEMRDGVASSQREIQKPTADQKDVNSELAALVGLLPVKEEIAKLRDYVAYQVELKRRGKTLSKVSNHCVFTGNPGTGKTTVARIIAQIYYEAGVIKENKIKEVDRSGLVAEYIGHTAVKTNKVIDEALDGVLFIDEAYALSGGGEKDFGKEAVDTLLKRMEDDRDRLVVIVAGYTKEMQQFIEMNPGLKSRFTRYIDFPDYSADELVEIFRRLLSKEGFVCGDDVINAFRQRMVAVTENKKRDFSNARFVRNLFEEMKRNLAVRVSGNLDRMSDRELQTVLVADLPK